MNIPILILTLHHVSPQKDSITIHPELVKKALQSVKDQGYKVISYAKFKDMAFGRIKREPKSVLLTFDDGYFDFYRYAYPILTKLQTPAVVFLITDKINDFKRKNFNLEPKPHSELDYKENIEYFLNLDEIRELYKSGLVEFDSHTATHFSCKSDDEIRLKDEFDRSYEKIKEIFPDKQEFGFCWPKGHFNDTAMKAIKNTNYAFAFSVIDGGFCDGDDMFKIHRIDISNNAKNDKAYLFRIKKKLLLYSMPIIGNLYSKFRNKKFK